MRIIGLAGWSGSGKTTLVARVIPIFVIRGLKVSTVKHAHKGFDIDIPGKDSHTHRMVGATEVFVASGKRWAHIHELRDEPEPDLADIVPKLEPVDILIVEGFKRHRHPKIEIYRAEVGKPLLHLNDYWRQIRAAADLPWVRLNDLRHSFASYAARSSETLPMIGKLLGHKKLGSTSRLGSMICVRSAARPCAPAADGAAVPGLLGSRHRWRLGGVDPAHRDRVRPF